MEVIETLIGQAVGVAKDNENTIESTNKLSNKIKRVENIIDDIAAISNQTNLLAFNASIEAARAGNAGKIIFRLIQVKISHKFKIIKVYTKFFKC